MDVEWMPAWVDARQATRLGRTRRLKGPYQWLRGEALSCAVVPPVPSLLCDAVAAASRQSPAASGGAPRPPIRRPCGRGCAVLNTANSPIAAMLSDGPAALAACRLPASALLVPWLAALLMPWLP
eukprot:290696-Chlamydomonas_euryale.AAC.1